MFPFYFFRSKTGDRAGDRLGDLVVLIPSSFSGDGEDPVPELRREDELGRTRVSKWRKRNGILLVEPSSLLLLNKNANGQLIHDEPVLHAEKNRYSTIQFI